MIKTLKLVMVLLLVCPIITKAQETKKFDLPTVLLPSPAAQNFMRYGEIPVDYSTGVPNINIPLYTVTSRQLSLPISVSYHASGIKVTDKASVIGLGWVLNAGGIVTGTSFSSVGSINLAYRDADLLNASRTAIQSNVTALQQWVSDRHYEMENIGMKSSRYTFQLPNGESGVFRYDFNNGNLIKLPYTPVKIMPNNVVESTFFPGEFTLTDTKGVAYTFNTVMSTNSNPNTWHLTRMVSADKSDTIRLVYKTTPNVYYAPSYTSILQLYEEPNTVPGISMVADFTPTVAGGFSPAIGVQTYEAVIDSIITASTIVKFTTNNDREDMANGMGKFRVTGITVRRRSDLVPIKFFTFNQGYFGTALDNKRLKLNGITIKGNDGASVQNYSLDYETGGGELPPYPENIWGSYTYKFHEDYWGYYNGSASNSQVPMQFVPTHIPAERTPPNSWPVSSDNYTNRNPDSIYAKVAMLKEIVYPSGGKTVFTFEPNRAAAAYSYPSGWAVPEIVGGFRIKRIANYLSDGTLAEHKTYSYSAGQTQMISDILYKRTRRDMKVLLFITAMGSGVYGQVNYTNTIISSQPFLPLTADNGPPIFYERVTEYQGTGTVNTGKTIYEYVAPPASPNTNYLDFEGPLFAGTPLDRGNYVPRLARKSVFRKTGSGYTPVQRLENGYVSDLPQTYSMGLHMVSTSGNRDNNSHLDYPLAGWHTHYQTQPTGFNGYSGGANYVIAKNIHATQEVTLLGSTAEHTYDPTDSTKYVTKTTSLTYGGLSGYMLGDAAHTEPTQTSTTASTGDVFLTTLSYPADNSASQPYSTMVSRNILTPVIEENSYKTNTSNFLQSKKTEYSFWDGSGTPTTSITDLIYPKQVFSKKSSGSYEPRLEYSRYDIKGNITDVQKPTGPHVSYLYDKLKIHPVAQVTNASIKDIFYESFEDGAGNSALDDSKTGHYSSTSGIYRSLSGLTAGTYTLSYWSKPSTTWVLNVSSVSVPGSTATINLSGQIDDVRFYPAGAQMTTYTYDPLVGQTSATDARNEVTYYAYDTFGRLKTIKDKDKNIVKSFCYNYKGQMTDCFAPEPIAPVTVYARIEQSNYSEGTPGNPDSEYWINNSATLTIKFYANSACTIPYILTSGTTVKINNNYTILHDMLGNYDYGQSTYNIAVPSGVSSYSMGTQMLYARHHFYDPGSSMYWDDHYWYDYVIVANSGSNYIPL